MQETPSSVRVIRPEQCSICTTRASGALLIGSGVFKYMYLYNAHGSDRPLHPLSNVPKIITTTVPLIRDPMYISSHCAPGISPSRAGGLGCCHIFAAE